MPSVDVSVTPISGSSIAWEVFLKDTVSLTGHSITRSIDATGLKLSDYARFIVTLGELRNGNALNPMDALGTAGNVLQHIHFSFLIVGPASLIFRLSETTDLAILSKRIDQGRFALVSGNLKEWKDAITELVDCKSTTVQSMILSLKHVFSRLGLKQVFSDSNIKRLK